MCTEGVSRDRNEGTPGKMLTNARGRWEDAYKRTRLMGNASEVQAVVRRCPQRAAPNKDPSLLLTATPPETQLLEDLITESKGDLGPFLLLPLCHLHALMLDPNNEGRTGIGGRPGVWSPQSPGTAWPEISLK